MIHKKKNYWKNKSGDGSITWLIIQITVILIVIGFVGHFLVSSQDSRADIVSTGNAVIKFSKQSIDINNVVAQGTSDRTIDALIITAEIEQSSDPVKLDDVIIIINQRNVSSILKYRNGTLTRDRDDGYYTE